MTDLNNLARAIGHIQHLLDTFAPTLKAEMRMTQAQLSAVAQARAFLDEKLSES